MSLQAQRTYSRPGNEELSDIQSAFHGKWMFLMRLMNIVIFEQIVCQIKQNRKNLNINSITTLYPPAVIFQILHLNNGHKCAENVINVVCDVSKT